MINRRRGRPNDTSKWRDNEKAVPPEVWEAFGDVSIKVNNGQVYAHVPKSKRPDIFKHLEFINVAKLVYRLHNPGYRICPRDQVRHHNDDKQDNTIENLYVRGDKHK